MIVTAERCRATERLEYMSCPHSSDARILPYLRYG
jgi:hypothetical protein